MKPERGTGDEQTDNRHPDELLNNLDAKGVSDRVAWRLHQAQRREECEEQPTTDHTVWRRMVDRITVLLNGVGCGDAGSLLMCLVDPHRVEGDGLPRRDPNMSLPDQLAELIEAFDAHERFPRSMKVSDAVGAKRVRYGTAKKIARLVAVKMVQYAYVAAREIEPDEAKCGVLVQVFITDCFRTYNDVDKLTAIIDMHNKFK